MKKTYSKTKSSCKVTFELFDLDGDHTVAVLGEFNDWQAQPLIARKNGRFSTTVSVPQGEYRYRYLLNGEQWINEPEAEKYLSNPFGTRDCVVTV